MPVRARAVRRLIGGALSATAMTMLICACGTGGPAGTAAGRTGSASATKTLASARPMTSAQPMASRSPSPVHSGGVSGGGAGSGPLHGKVVVLDPGHNGGNAAAAPVINKPIWNGRTSEACDTTGAQTAGGYTEARFNWNVARYVAADLRAKGATVILTRSSNTGVGPCVTRRTAIGNDAHANAALSIHADGGPTSGRGFAVLEPVADGPNDAIIGRSDTLGTDLRDAFAAGTGEPVSSYDGTNGLKSRDDLAGTNLSTVPKVFIECANMTNTADAALVTSDSWQQKAARAITAGLTAYLKAS